jgi:glycosyltransferase involved in cell wall biosynthesis
MTRPLAIFAATSGHSGVDRVFANLVPQLDRWGVRVDLLRIRGHGPEFSLDDLRNCRLVDLGVAHVTSSLPAVARYLRRERPAALLCDKDRVNRAAILARALARVDTRLAVRLGSTMSVNLARRNRWDRWVQETSIRRLYPHADCIIVPSQGVADDLISYLGVAPGHIRVVPSPVLTPRLEERAREGMDHPWFAPGEPPVVLGVGELSFRKDFQTLVRAFALVRRRRPCRLVILGRGRYRDELLALADQLGVAADLDLPGFCANPYAYMARAGLFVLSSRWEGMPVALVEALAVGTPVVSTDCPSGPREILAGSGLGGLVPVGGVEEMADAIARWMGAAPPAEDFRRAIEPYRVEASAREYLRALGFSPAELPGVDATSEGGPSGPRPSGT